MNSQRRHHADRMLRKAKLIAKLQSGLGTWTGTNWAPVAPEQTAKRARRIRDHRCACSCQMCRNPRRSALTKGKKRPTLQERRELPCMNLDH